MSAHVFIGSGLATLGAIVLAWLVTLLYGEHLSPVLLWLGIPGSLLLCLAGLCFFFFGSAIAARRTRRKRN